MALTVLSWNMQGCNDDSKIKALQTLVDHILDEGNQCVVLLQECGDQKSNGFYPQKPVAWNEKLNCICYNHEHLSFEHRSSMTFMSLHSAMPYQHTEDELTFTVNELGKYGGHWMFIAEFDAETAKNILGGELGPQLGFKADCITYH